MAGFLLEAADAHGGLGGGGFLQHLLQRRQVHLAHASELLPAGLQSLDPVGDEATVLQQIRSQPDVLGDRQLREGLGQGRAGPLAGLEQEGGPAVEPNPIKQRSDSGRPSGWS